MCSDYFKYSILGKDFLLSLNNVRGKYCDVECNAYFEFVRAMFATSSLCVAWYNVRSCGLIDIGKMPNSGTKSDGMVRAMTLSTTRVSSDTHCRCRAFMILAWRSTAPPQPAQSCFGNLYLPSGLASDILFAWFSSTFTPRSAQYLIAASNLSIVAFAVSPSLSAKASCCIRAFTASFTNSLEFLLQSTPHSMQVFMQCLYCLTCRRFSISS